MATLLEVRDLKTHFFTPEGVVKAVDGVSDALEEGETLGRAAAAIDTTLSRGPGTTAVHVAAQPGD